MPASTRIVVIGDVIDDIMVVPKVAVRHDTDTTATIRHRAGGSAANTAVWLGTLRGGVDFIGRVGASDIQRHAQNFINAGVDAWLTRDPTEPTGTIVIIVDGDERTMLTERGANSNLDVAAVTDDMLGSAAILHLTGYSVIDCRDPAALRGLIDRAIAQGVLVSIDPGSAGYIADFGVKKFLAAVAGATIIFPNLDEGRLLSGETEPAAVTDALAALFPVVAVTLGPDGVMLAQPGIRAQPIAALKSKIVDPTGAGDAFAAGFLGSYSRDRNAQTAAKAGVRTAARALSVIGGRPLV